MEEVAGAVARGVVVARQPVDQGLDGGRLEHGRLGILLELCFEEAELLEVGRARVKVRIVRSRRGGERHQRLWLALEAALADLGAERAAPLADGVLPLERALGPLVL